MNGFPRASELAEHIKDDKVRNVELSVQIQNGKVLKFSFAGTAGLFNFLNNLQFDLANSEKEKF